MCSLFLTDSPPLKRWRSYFNFCCTYLFSPSKAHWNASDCKTLQQHLTIFLCLYIYAQNIDNRFFFSLCVSPLSLSVILILFATNQNNKLCLIPSVSKLGGNQDKAIRHINALIFWLALSLKYGCHADFCLVRNSELQNALELVIVVRPEISKNSSKAPLLVLTLVFKCKLEKIGEKCHYLCS